MKTVVKEMVPRLAVSLAALFCVLFFLRDKLGDALAILRGEVHWPWVFFGFAIYAVTQTLMAFRLQLTLRVQSILLTYGETLYMTLVGLFFNLFLPSAVGGDFAKIYYVYKYSGKKIESTTSVILDRLMGFVAIIAIAMIALTLIKSEWDDVNLTTIVYVFLGVMLLTVFFFGSKRFARFFKFLAHLIPSERIRRRLSDLYHAIYSYKNHKKTLIYCIILSLAAQSLFIMVHYVLALSLGVRLSPGIFFLLVPVVAIVSMAPSVGGLGVREAGSIYFFSRYMNSERALALSLLLFCLIYSTGLIAGMVYALRGGLKAKVIDEIDQMEALTKET